VSLQIFVIYIGAAEPYTHKAFTANALGDRRPLCAAPCAGTRPDLRVAELPTAALLATKALALREAPDAALAHAIDSTIGMGTLKVILTTACTLADRSISSVLSLLH